MEQQRNDLSGGSGLPQTSEAGTGVSRRQPSKHLAGPKPVGDRPVLPAFSSNISEKTGTISQTNKLEKAESIGHAKIIEKIEALKRTDWPGKVKFPLNPAPAPASGNHQQTQINTGSTKEPQQNGFESNLLLDEEEEDKAQNTIRSEAVNSTFAPDTSNQLLMDMLGGDDVECSSAILQQTGILTERINEMKKLGNNVGNRTRNVLEEYSKKSDFVLRQRDDVPTLGRACGGGADGAQYGLLPPGMPKRGTALAAAPNRNFQKPYTKEVSAFGDVAVGNSFPSRFPVRDAQSKTVIEPVPAPELEVGRVKIPNGPKSLLVRNSEEVRMDERRGNGMYNNVGRTIGNSLEGVPSTSFKGQPIWPQDLVAQVLSTRPAQTNVTIESPSNKGQIFSPLVSPPEEASLNPRNFSVPLHPRTPPQIHQPTPFRGPSFSQLASLQNKSLSFYPNPSESPPKQTETKLSSSNTRKQMDKKTLLNSSSKNNSKPPDKMMADTDNNCTSYSIHGDDVIKNPTTLENPSCQGPEEEDPDYNWEFLPKRMPTCRKCYKSGHPTRVCPELRPMPLEFLQVEARQDGVKVKFHEGNFPSYRLNPVNPLDKVCWLLFCFLTPSSYFVNILLTFFLNKQCYREKLARNAKGISSPEDSSDDEAFSAADLVSEKLCSQQASPDKSALKSADSSIVSNNTIGTMTVWDPKILLSHTDEGKPRKSAVQELQEYIDKTSYWDIERDCEVCPFEWHIEIIDKCFKSLAVEEELKEFRDDRAPALSAHKDRGYRAGGVKLFHPVCTPVQDNILKNANCLLKPPQPKAESVTSTDSSAFEAEAVKVSSPVLETVKVSSPVFSKTEVAQQIKPQTPATTRTPSAGPSTQVKQSPVTTQVKQSPPTTQVKQSPPTTQVKQSPPTGPSNRASPPVRASDSKNLDEESAGYVVRKRICFNCWDGEHSGFECKLMPKMFHVRERLRRERKIWSFSWAQLLYHKNEEYMLFVPSQFREEFERWKTTQRAREDAVYKERLFGSEVPASFAEANTHVGKSESICSPSQPATPDKANSAPSRPTPATSPAQCVSPVTPKRAEVSTSTLKVDEDAGHKVVVYKGSRAPSRGAVRHWDAACWNCWGSDLHFVKTCPEVRRTDREREILRREKMVFSRRWNQHMHHLNRDGEVLPLSEMPNWYERYHAGPPLDSRSPSPESPKGRAVSPRTPPGNYHASNNSRHMIISAENPCWQCRGVHEQFACPRDPPGLRNGAPEGNKPVTGYKGKEKALPISEPAGSEPRSSSPSYYSSGSSAGSKTPKYTQDDISKFEASLWVASTHPVNQRFSLSREFRTNGKRRGHHVDPYDTYPASYYREQEAKKAAREKKASKPFTGRALFPQLPTEILENIFKMVWDRGVVKDGFTGDSNEHVAMAKRIQCREYRALLRVNKRCCAIAQRLIFSSMTIIDRHAMVRFMKVLMSEHNTHLRQYVQHINFAIVPIVNSQAQFRFSPRRRTEMLDEIEAKRFNGPEVDEKMMYFKSLKFVSFLIKQCPKLQTLFAQFRGAIVGFEKVSSDREYEQLRELTLKDKDCTAVSLRNLWRFAQQCPSLKSLALEYGSDNRKVDFAPLAIRSSLAIYKNGFYNNLTSLYFTQAPEISDEWLVIFASRMPKLQKIHIEDCKNVSSDGKIPLLNVIGQY